MSALTFYQNSQQQRLVKFGTGDLPMRQAVSPKLLSLNAVPQ